MTVWLGVFGGLEHLVYPTRIVSAKIEATVLQAGHVSRAVRGATTNYPEYAWEPVKVMRGVVIKGQQRSKLSVATISIYNSTSN